MDWCRMGVSSSIQFGNRGDIQISMEVSVSILRAQSTSLLWKYVRRGTISSFSIFTQSDHRDDWADRMAVAL